CSSDLSERLLSEISGFRSRIELNRQRTEELNELIAKAHAEIAAAESKRTKQQVEMEQVTELVTKTVSLLAGQREQVTELEGRIRDRKSRRTACETELQQL